MSFITSGNYEIPYSMRVRFDGWYEKFINMDYINYLFGKDRDLEELAYCQMDKEDRYQISN